MEFPSSRCPSRAARPHLEFLGEGFSWRDSPASPADPSRSLGNPGGALAREPLGPSVSTLGLPESGILLFPRSTQAATSSFAKTEEAGEQERVFKDKDVMFVDDSHLVRELLKLGFRVRAGVRSAQTVEPLGQVGDGCF
ncbi:hypothetical protein MUK42_34184 [Musa troglodytarum]|uniref:Uncharacterized protein n=1 Tax=Musa troglodytarum TaxID=320322 RepID=A0A9E7JA77_9LILI|nr:hypothetical protein MUK42_34184 [Musa troglodytarum]